MSDEKIYIAGENGLVGSQLIRSLKAAGKNIVSTTSDKLDLRDSEKVHNFFNSERPDHVVLVAARHGGIGEYQQNPVEYLDDNVRIFGNVIRTSYEFGVKRLINIGASCVYEGTAGQLLREADYDKSAVQKPTEPYGIAKLYGMKLCEYYNREKGTEFISLLPTNLYGDGLGYHVDESSVLPAMLRRFHIAKLEGKECVKIWGDGKSHREFLHVRDFVEAISVLLLTDEIPYTMYNIGSGEVLTINELAVMVAQIVGYAGEIFNDLSKPSGADRGILDCSRIRQMGWKPRISLLQGVSELYANLVQQQVL